MEMPSVTQIPDRTGSEVNIHRKAIAVYNHAEHDAEDDVTLDSAQ